MERKMIEYEVVYYDNEGNKDKYLVDSWDVRAAMNAFFKLVPAAERIISCKPTSTN